MSERPKTDLVAEVAQITLRRADDTFWDDWQGDLDDIDLDESLEAWDETVQARVSDAFPRAAVVLTRESAEAVGVITYADDDAHDEAERMVRDTVDRIEAEVGNHPEWWVIRYEDRRDGRRA